MAHANSEWIVQLHFAFQDNKYLYMVMDYMPGIYLYTYIYNFVIIIKWKKRAIYCILSQLNNYYKNHNKSIVLFFKLNMLLVSIKMNNFIHLKSYI